MWGKWCPQNNIGVIDNWMSFWGRPDLLKMYKKHFRRKGPTNIKNLYDADDR